MKNKILDVKNLRISFRTSAGKVQAVRDIDFELYKGETLAIVGESGSGKSVTSRAIMGILAGNAIVEGGSIVYSGQDLLQITEDDFHKIRGDRIAMIFQDPLSSLNPIVRIGKQLTEAMILKNKTGRRRARKEFNTTLDFLKQSIISGMLEKGSSEQETKSKIEEKCHIFDSFCIEAINLQLPYLTAKTDLSQAIRDIDRILLFSQKEQKADYQKLIENILESVNGSCHNFLVDRSKISSSLDIVKSEKSKCKLSLTSDCYKALENILKILRECEGMTEPNFFCLGYYKNFHADEIARQMTSSEIDAINKSAHDFLDSNFMKDFLRDIEIGLAYSYNKSIDQKKAVLKILGENRAVFENPDLDKKKAKEICDILSDSVELSIDKLAIIKDSIAYTFRSSMITNIEKYFDGIKNNPKEIKRFESQTKKFNELDAKGKTPDWKVTPAAVVDLDLTRQNLLNIIDRLIEKYNADVKSKVNDFTGRSIEMVDFFKEKSIQVVSRVTKKAAKLKAIQLMEEVGIAEPEKRYRQYPFEFSGGMRQRIVIAIALAANPEILICDEPTTALDVTIQSQILELINKLKQERKLSVIFITHDLGVVANMADRVAVMYAGKIVEYGTADDIFYSPAHPYTWALLSSMPDLDTTEKLEAIPGTPPNMIYPPVGDAFALRNKYALDIDFEMQPPMFEISETHSAATWLLHPYAPKVEPPKLVTERIERMKARGGADHA